MGMSPLKTPVDRSAPNLAEWVSSPNWSPMTFFGNRPRGFDSVRVEFCHFPISRLSPLTQCWRPQDSVGVNTDCSQLSSAPVTLHNQTECLGLFVYRCVWASSIACVFFALRLIVVNTFWSASLELVLYEVCLSSRMFVVTELQRAVNDRPGILNTVRAYLDRVYDSATENR